MTGTLLRAFTGALVALAVAGGCGGSGRPSDGGRTSEEPRTTGAGAGDPFVPTEAVAPFDPCEALLAASAEFAIPLYEGLEPTSLDLPGQNYVAFTCSAPIDDGRNLTLNVKAVALADPEAARREMESLGEAFGGVTVEEGLEDLPEGSFVAQGADGENPELYVLFTDEPFAVSVVGGGTNADLDLAKQVAAFLLART